MEISKAFYLGACPVTKGQFAAFVKDDDYQTDAEGAGDVRTWRYPGFGQTDDDPVVEVTWNDAVKFCKWLSWKEKQTYELPTEAQWEYACRAGTKTAYFFGDDESDLDAYAWYGGNSGNHTHPVGKKKPNGWGLYDMSGNVWQWCADSYDGKYYNNSPNKDPRNMLNTGTRVVRGGSWLGGASYWRTAVRYSLAPVGHGVNFGFRVCGPETLSDEKAAEAKRHPAVKEEKPPIVFADFEGRDYGGWKATGQAFGAGPAYGTLPYQLRVSGYEGRGLVNSFHGGDNAVGSLTSPEFTIERRYISFLIGGGNRPGTACINLFVDDKVVRTATGKNNEKLEWCIWDVRDFAGRTGRFRIVDNAVGPWGHINIDQIEFRDAPRPGESAPRRTIGSPGRRRRPRNRAGTFIMSKTMNVRRGKPRRNHDENDARKSPRQDHRAGRRPRRAGRAGGRGPGDGGSGGRAANARRSGEGVCRPGRAVRLRRTRRGRPSQRASAMTAVFLDTVGLLAVWDGSDQWHAAADAAYQKLLGQARRWSRLRSCFWNAAMRPPAGPTGRVSTCCGNVSSRRVFWRRRRPRKSKRRGPPMIGATRRRPGSSIRFLLW